MAPEPGTAARGRTRLRRPRGRFGRALRPLVALAVGLLVLTSFSGAAAQPGAGDATLSTIAAQAAAAAGPGCDGTAGDPYASGLPAIPYCYFTPGGPNRYQDYGGVIKSTTQDALRPKVTIDFPPLVLRTFYVVCYFTANPPPCPVPIEFPKFDPTVTPYYVGLSTDVWIQSEPGATPQYGDFPPIQVTTMAFGSLPVTATVTVKQVRDDTGQPEPLHLSWVLSGGVQPGKQIPGYPEYGGAPTYPNGAQAYFTPPPEISGRIVITVSDVHVDQVPLDVGPACEAQTSLNLTAAGGFYNSTQPPKEGEPGEFSPVNNTFPDADQYLRGTVDIPAFSGCKNGSQDVSALITGTVSGQGNPVRSVLEGALKNFGCLAAQTPNCENTHPPYYVPPAPSGS